MTSSLRPGRLLLLVAGMAAVLVTSACTASAPGADVSISSERPTHDEVDGGGAAEVAAPALALVVADTAGEVVLLDLDSEQRTTLREPGDGVVSGGGRFVHVIDATARTTLVDVIDTGRWTVPHGDHSHSFLAEPHSLGTVDGSGEVDVRVGDHATAIRFGDADLAVLDHETIADLEPARITLAASTPGPVLPFSGHLLVASGSTVDILDADGVPVAGGAPCTAATDADITRVGAVFACAEGAVLVTREVGGALAAENIPTPATAPPAPLLSGRADRPDLAGVAGTQGAWLLDVRNRAWMLLATDTPLIAASAIGDDDSRTVAIAADGTIRVIGADGGELGRTEPLLAASVADPALRARVQLIVDAHHAYVSDPADGSVHEIDHADAVVTRTFRDLGPQYLQLVG